MAENKKEIEAQELEMQVAPEAGQPLNNKKNNNKHKIKIKLTGAGSYNNLNFNLGLIKKGEVKELEADMAEKFLNTGLFERV